MAALQSQLRRIVARRFPEVDLDAPLQQNPDTLTATTLKQALAAGWADQVRKDCVTRRFALKSDRMHSSLGSFCWRPAEFDICLTRLHWIHSSV